MLPNISLDTIKLREESNEMDIENDIITNDGEDIFQMRLMKSEGIGLATTKSGKSYLILDSQDYWYDCIQDAYPGIKKCSCKNDWFKLKFKYYYRTHYDDVKRIEVKTFCTNCGKALTVLDIDIKYSPTEHLVKNPLVYCQKPNIKYNSKTISRIWKLDEFHKIIRYLSELGFSIYCWYWNDKNKKRETRIVSTEEIKQVVSFLMIYITQNEINIDDFTLTTNELGIYMDEDLWRKNEIIEICSAHIAGAGINYMLEYSTQFIDAAGEVKDKSQEFAERIAKFEKWLHENC
jgi:hypothetical protein